MLFAMVITSACHNPNETGAGLLPEGDQINAVFTDSFTIELNSFLVDSVNTTNLTYVMFGDYIDPEFGHISAGSGIQFTIIGTGNKLIDSSNAVLDSVFLDLVITDAYGRTSDPLELEVFEITDPGFHVDSLFNSKTALNLSTTELSGGYVLEFGSSPVGKISIPLDSAFGWHLLTTPEDTLASNEIFNEYFSGLFIAAVPVALNSREPGAIYSIDVRDSETAIRLHYHEDSISKEFSFVVDAGTTTGQKGNSARYSKISRTDAASHLIGQHIDQPLLNDFEFIQAGALVKMHFRLPHLLSIYPIGINKAELILYPDPEVLGSEFRFQPPSSVFAFESDSTGRKEINLADPVALASFNQTTGAYTIPLSRYTAEVLAGIRTDYGLIIEPAANGVSMNRAVIGGTGNASIAPKFKVIYTTFPK